MNKRFFLWIIFILLLASCSWEEEIIKKYFETSTVSTWSIFDTKYQVWYTRSFHSTALWPKVWWKISSIYKDVWDIVRAWELLGVLDWAEARTWFWSSVHIISNLENLKKSIELSYDAQIKAMEEKITQLEKTLEIADISISGANLWVDNTQNINKNQIDILKTQISQAKLWLETAQLNYKNTKKLLTQKKQDIFINSQKALSRSSVLWNNIIDFLDNIFWITDINKHKNNSFEIYLWARNSWKKQHSLFSKYSTFSWTIIYWKRIQIFT